MTNQDKFMYALCIWREAKNSTPGMLAVAWVMMNRLASRRWGLTMTDVVTARLQFSSMTALGDPMTVSWPNSSTNPADLAAWQYAQGCPDLVIGASASLDPTAGALYYFAENITKPDWADGMLLTTTIGGQEFYKLAGSTSMPVEAV